MSKIYRGFDSLTGCQLKMYLPIIYNHDQTRPIGNIEEVDGKVIVTLIEKVTKRQFCASLGCGFKILEAEFDEKIDEMYIKKAEIIEFSIYY